MAVPVGIDLYPEQPEILRAARVPIVKSWRPMWPYITAVWVHEISEGGPITALMPTEVEQRQIASFHQQYVSYWYGTAPGQFTGWYDRQRAENEFDIDGGANGRFFGQRLHEGWTYSRRTWEHGPRPEIGQPPMTLLEAMDRACHGNHSWNRWKSTDPELFGPEAYSAARAALEERLEREARLKEAARGEA